MRNSQKVACGVMRAQFVKDDTIADGTHVQPGTRLIKRWVMLNSGDLPWDSNTKVCRDCIRGVSRISQRGRPRGRPNELRGRQKGLKWRSKRQKGEAKQVKCRSKGEAKGQRGRPEG